MLPRRIYLEGRCRQCGMRVTVVRQGDGPLCGSGSTADREGDGHMRAGAWCGPVETEQPSEVPDEPMLDWVVTSPLGGRGAVGALPATSGGRPVAPTARRPPAA